MTPTHHHQHHFRVTRLLSTERGRRTAIFSSIQCLLSVIGSMGFILLFAGIPQLIYSNVLTFLLGVLLLSLMVAGNACISYKFRTQLDVDQEGVIVRGEDKPPTYEDVCWGDITPPPDYYTVVPTNTKTNSSGTSSEKGFLVDVAAVHGSQLRRNPNIEVTTFDLQRHLEPNVTPNLETNLESPNLESPNLQRNLDPNLTQNVQGHLEPNLIPNTSPNHISNITPATLTVVTNATASVVITPTTTSNTATATTTSNIISTSTSPNTTNTSSRVKPVASQLWVFQVTCANTSQEQLSNAAVSQSSTGLVEDRNVDKVKQLRVNQSHSNLTLDST